MRNPEPRVEQSLIPVVNRWATQDKALLLPLFQLIASGDSLDEAEIAHSLSRNKSELDASLATSLAQVDRSGHVAELFGITREPTLHRIEVGGTTLYSCCALVAHMVPAILRQAVVIESTDPIGGGKLGLEISAESELQHVDHAQASASMIDCAVNAIVSDPRRKFCCHVKHFTATETATAFIDQSSNRYLMAIEDFHSAALWLYKRIWAD